MAGILLTTETPQWCRCGAMHPWRDMVSRMRVFLVAWAAVFPLRLRNRIVLTGGLPALLNKAVLILICCASSTAALAQTSQCNVWYATPGNGARYFDWSTEGASQLEAASKAIERLNGIFSPIDSGVCAGEMSRIAHSPVVETSTYGWYSVDAHFVICTPGPCRCERHFWQGSPILFSTGPCALQIDLFGASRTKALPAGPTLPQTARVTQSGAPAPGISVQLQVQGTGGVSTLNGTTNSAGEVMFRYIPPWLAAATDSVSATCSGCSNTVTKSITVEVCDICSAPGQ